MWKVMCVSRKIDRKSEWVFICEKRNIILYEMKFIHTWKPEQLNYVVCVSCKRKKKINIKIDWVRNEIIKISYIYLYIVMHTYVWRENYKRNRIAMVSAVNSSQETTTNKKQQKSVSVQTFALDSDLTLLLPFNHNQSGVVYEIRKMEPRGSSRIRSIAFLCLVLAVAGIIGFGYFCDSKVSSPSFLLKIQTPTTSQDEQNINIVWEGYVTHGFLHVTAFLFITTLHHARKHFNYSFTQKLLNY